MRHLCALVLAVLIAGCASAPAPLATVAVASPRLPPPVESAHPLPPLPPGTTPPRPNSIRFPQPGDYPAAERRARIGGSPRVRVLVDETGRVADAEVIGTVSPGLDSLALALVSQAGFFPGQTGGVRTPMTVDVTYTFVAP